MASHLSSVSSLAKNSSGLYAVHQPRRISQSSPSSAATFRRKQNILPSSTFVVRSTHSCFFNGGESYESMVATYSSDGTMAVGGACASRMNVFDRVSRIVKSYVNAALTAAEDPEKLLDQTVEEMTEDLIKLRQSTAQIIASRNILGNKYKQAQSNSDAWYKRAKLALEKGDEGLAKEALKRKKDEEEAANSLKSQLEQQEGIVEKLVSNTKLLESKIQEAKSKKDALKARAQSAKTSTKVNELLGNLNTSSALAAFDKMEEKVMALEAQSEAMNQLTADELSTKFAMLESGDVDDDLAKLKQDVLGSSRRPGELPPGRSNIERSLKDLDLEAELNELRRRRD